MSDGKPIVYVVDDDPSVLKSLERLLKSSSYEVRTFTSAQDFLDFHHPDAPGCIVLDAEMPDLSGLEMQKSLAGRDITFPVVFITGHGTIPMSVQAMRAGAVDFLQKPFDAMELLNTISRAIERHCLLKRDETERRSLRMRMQTLTLRELQVFRLVVAGMLNKQIAFELGTSEKTIKVHRARVYHKMQAHSLAELVRFAEKLGIHSEKP